ncbi:hypothetical protein EOL70_12445 [Leucothrix sargassi]|nr:hypothetical protein EOL70_12445 [Leucothrix sargassi]
MHSLHGFIAIEDVAREFEHSFNEGTPPAAKSIGLPQGFGLVPMTPQLRERLAEVTGEADTPLDVFSELTESAMWVANMLSQVGKVVYIQSENDAAQQSAMVWEFGEVIYQPTQSATAINEALKVSGVDADGATDEFAALGLADHESTEAWYKAALKYKLAVPDMPLEFDD